jgi:DNA-binding CsgD family transcriptional regulator
MNQTRRQSDPIVLPQLTQKQREVMALVADNRTSKEIAGRLGISESAVNQRIELIRARLGGIPRGEMARLYRQEFERERRLAATFPPTWEKIQVPSETTSSEGAPTEGMPDATAARLQPGAGDIGLGSQPSLGSLPVSSPRADREELPNALAALALIAAIIAGGIVLAILVTNQIAG